MEADEKAELYFAVGIATCAIVLSIIQGGKINSLEQDVHELRKQIAEQYIRENEGTIK